MTGAERFVRHATFEALSAPGLDLAKRIPARLPGLARAVTNPAMTTVPAGRWN